MSRQLGGINPWQWGYLGLLANHSAVPAMPLAWNCCSGKGPLEVYGPASFSKLDQDWIHAKFLRASASQSLKVSKDGDCTASLGNLFQDLNILTIERSSLFSEPSFVQLQPAVPWPSTVHHTGRPALWCCLVGAGFHQVPSKSSPGQTRPGPSASSHRQSTPALNIFQFINAFPLLGVQNWMQYLDVVPKVFNREAYSLSSISWPCFCWHLLVCWYSVWTEVWNTP